jgi:hypothetical protein
MTRRRHFSPTSADPGQASLLADAFSPFPKRPSAVPGSLGVATRVAGLVAYALDQARIERGLSREVVAAQMSDLTSERITRDMLNAMTADSHQGHRFPIQWLPALIQVTGCYELLTQMAELVGAMVLVGQDVIRAQMAEQDRIVADAQAKRRRLARMGGLPHA